MKPVEQLLKEGRESKGLLLREVAAAINADTALISKFEKGERKPTRDQITLLAKVLVLDEKELIIAYLSDKIAADLFHEDLAKDVLKVAEKKIDLLKKESTK